MNLLFVCSRNEWRSKTAETIFKNNNLHQVKSAGTSKKARIKLNQQMIDWADLVFLMEHKHKNIMKQNFIVDKMKEEIIVLDIPDNYQYMDEELIGKLKVGVNQYLVK